MPITEGNHHYMCSAGMEKKEFCCVDSMLSKDNEVSKVKRLFQRFLTLLKLNKIEAVEWKATS